jgi:dTDP-4-dehydrorhamnose 3,5-epimerase
MKFKALSIPDVILIEPRVFEDPRGFFYESYREDLFFQNGITQKFVQDNHSRSTKGVLRGLHYQISPRAQAKLVRVVKGEVFDVAVDIRKDSKTFGKYVGELLNENNKRMMYIPLGFAHGYLTLRDHTEFLYKCSDFYSPQPERGILWDDRDIAISWPKIDIDFILSEKDKKYPSLKDFMR